MTMTYKIQQILEKFGNFDITSGCRMLMLINRSKNEKDRNANKSIRRISKNREEFIDILEEFLEKRNENERIYSCVNERDIDKAIRIFKQKQLDADYYDTDSKHKFYLDIKNRWMSAIMQPQVQKTKYFLIDVDTKDKKVLDDVKKKICLFSANYIRYETKNGFHFICPPFNPILLQDVDIKKDGMLLLDY